MYRFIRPPQLDKVEEEIHNSEERMRRKLMILAMNCLIIILISSVYTMGQETESSITESSIRDKKITLRTKKSPLRDIAAYLFIKYDIAIGFEESTFDRGHDDYLFRTNLPYDKKLGNAVDGDIPIKQKWFSLDIENERLEDVLNLIVGQMKNYKWEINDEVVNIFPNKGRDERYKELLNLNISEFSLEKNEPMLLIRRNIMDLPEIKNFLEEKKITFRYSRRYVQHSTRPLPVELKFSNIKLKDLLNKITKIKRGGWIMRGTYAHGLKMDEYIKIEIEI